MFRRIFTLKRGNELLLLGPNSCVYLRKAIVSVTYQNNKRPSEGSWRWSDLITGTEQCQLTEQPATREEKGSFEAGEGFLVQVWLEKACSTKCKWNGAWDEIVLSAAVFRFKQNRWTSSTPTVPACTAFVLVCVIVEGCNQRFIEGKPQPQESHNAKTFQSHEMQSGFTFAGFTLHCSCVDQHGGALQHLVEHSGAEWGINVWPWLHVVGEFSCLDCVWSGKNAATLPLCVDVSPLRSSWQ